MSKKRLLSTLIAGLFVSAPALAADQPDQFIAEGAVSAGYLTSSVDGDGNPAKLKEYQDLSSGVVSNVFLRGRSGNAWFDAFGENFGRDDQYMAIRGGMYDQFKFRMYSDSLPHEFLFNGRTPQGGTFPAPDPSLWNQVDIGYKRTDNGGYFEWQGNRPWYARVEGNQVKFDGSKVGAASLGTSPGNGFMDLALPVQWTTNNVTGEVGYNTGPMNLSASWTYSKFTNDQDTLRWTNPFFGNGTDATLLAPNNDYNHFALNGTFRQLPYNSTFAARYTWSELKSSDNLFQTWLTGNGPTYGNTLPNQTVFNGKIDDQVFTLTLASAPMKGVDTRIYYNFYDRKNKSDEIEYAAASAVNCGGGVCDADLFSFRKHNFGIEGFWRFAPGNRLGAGYEYWSRDYEGRPDYSGGTDNRFFVEWKNTQLPNLSARLKYTYLQRDADFLLGNEGTTGNDAAYINRFVSAFDMSAVHRNELKLNVDWTAMPLLDLSFEGFWRDNKYQDITFGRTNDKRYNLYGSASWGDFKSLRLTLFGDYEEIKYDSAHRYIGAVPCNVGSGLLCNDPTQPPNALAYNWNSNTKDKNWMVGVGADFPINERLMLKGSFLYVETDGNADFNSQCGGTPGLASTVCPPVTVPPSTTATAAIVPFPIGNFDDTKRTSFNLKAIYAMNKNWSFTAGYAYEKGRYDDVSYAGYQYTVPFPAVTNNTGQSYLNGYGANQNFTANIFYLVGTYRF